MHVRELMKYFDENGWGCNVPRLHSSLGVWVSQQRTGFKKNKRADDKHSGMTEERIKILTIIGFEWDASNREWYEWLEEYKKEHGNCCVPSRYKAKKNLGRWVRNQRNQYRKMKMGLYSTMTVNRERQLEAVGFVWDARW